MWVRSFYGIRWIAAEVLDVENIVYLVKYSTRLCRLSFFYTTYLTFSGQIELIGIYACHYCSTCYHLTSSAVRSSQQSVVIVR